MNDPEVLSLAPRIDWSRRESVVATLARLRARRAAGIRSNIMTDDKELTTGEVKIPVKGGSIPAYRAMPQHGDKLPIVLVVQEIFGVHEHIKDVRRRFAKLGLMAVAPELYARQGDVSKLSGIEEIRTRVVNKVPDAQVMSDLDAAAAWAANQKGESSKLGITGFCWGGRIVWLYAAHNPQLKAGVAWYGHLAGDSTELQPKYPIDVAASSRRRCSAFTAARTRAFRSNPSSACAPP